MPPEAVSQYAVMQAAWLVVQGLGPSVIQKLIQERQNDPSSFNSAHAHIPDGLSRVGTPLAAPEDVVTA